MDHLKYVMFKTSIGMFPHVFHNKLVHKAVARHMVHCALTQDGFRFTEFEPISAGFVAPQSDGTFVAFGRSESLNLDSRPEDTEIINDFFGK